jgi:hypothetical protein
MPTLWQSGMRSAEKPAHGADQQRQTHWRRCGGGPSGGSECDTAQPKVESKPVVKSLIGIGSTSIGATECWTRFAGRAAARSQQQCRFALPGALRGSDR